MSDISLIEEFPTIGLKDTIKNLEVLVEGVDGTKCPRCGEHDFWKAGKYKTTEGQYIPRRFCRNCGYAYSILDIKQDSISRNRAARVFNLDDKKTDNLIEDTILFGLIKKEGDHYISSLEKIRPKKSELYNNIPLYHHLIESLGLNPKRSDFEKSLKSFLDIHQGNISKIKRNVLWRKYQGIAVDIFVCEKTCKFDRTCIKKQPERMGCDIVKKAKTKRREWHVDIEIPDPTPARITGGSTRS